MTCLINIWESKHISQMLDTTDKDSEVYTIMNEWTKKRKQLWSSISAERRQQYVKVWDHFCVYWNGIFWCLLFDIRVRLSCSHMSKQTGSKWKRRPCLWITSPVNPGVKYTHRCLNFLQKQKYIWLRFLAVPLSFVPTAQNHWAPMFPRKTWLNPKKICTLWILLHTKWILL